MSAQSSPFGPSGIAGGPLTETQGTLRLTDAEHAEAHAKLRAARKAVDDESDARALELGWHLDRDARAFVGEL